MAPVAIRSTRVVTGALLCLLLLAPAPGGAATHFSRPLGPAPEPVEQPDGRMAYETGFSFYAQLGDLRLRHPAAIVERIGFHESNHEGALDQRPAHWAAGPVALPSRGRLTERHSAADIVVAPDTAIHAPVSGQVLRAGTYVLYCRYSDDYVVIAPDSHPDLEVSMLHIDGVQVEAGDRVEAGESLLAPRATVLPFRSQVDRTTAEPSWPHVHLQVVDPAVENIPNPNSGGTCAP